MFKDAKDYTTEELLRACQDFFGAVYWAWYEVAVRVVGEEKANALLIELAEKFSALEAETMRQMWGKPFQSLVEITKPLDVIHRMVAYEGPTRGSTPVWAMENENKGYEKIYHCPIFATTPPEVKDKGPTALCTVYCHTIGQKFYGRMGCSIEQDSWLSKGQSCCGFRIERKPELVQLPSQRDS